MVTINKEDIDLDEILVELKFVLKGFRQRLSIHTTASEACNFVDVMNNNRHRKLSKKEQEMMDNRFYSFDDYKKKSTVTINLQDIKAMEIPFFLDQGKEYDLKVLMMGT